MSVPSNLIPTRVTQLPIAPVADENSLMMIVYQGNNYQIRVGDLLSVAGVPITRQVIAGTGMTGGGQLSSNVTLSIANGGVGSAQLASSGVTPGVYGTATDIPVFTVDSTGRVTAATTIPATVSGYVPDTRQVIAGTGLNGGGMLSTNVTLNANLSNATPEFGFQAGSAGVSTNISRADHKHPAIDLSDDDQVDNILGLNNGGTARSLVPNAGAVVWSGADGLYIGPAGVYGQVLTSGGTNQPIWASIDVDVPRPANTVRAGPTSGADAIPTFRALVNADIPTTLDAKTLTNVAINSGNINNTTIGGTTPAAVTGTTITANTQFSGPGTGLTGTAAGLSIGGNAATATTVANLAGGGANQIPYNTAASTTSYIAAPTVSNTFLEWSGSAFQWAANPLGTVTSVSLALPSEFTISGSPVTSSGTLTGSWANQTANYFLAAPNGSSGTPSFRAVVAADIPTLNQNTTGSAGSVVNAVTFNNTGGNAPNVTFNGSAALTVDYSTVGAPKADGTNATGTWGINISGNAATATSATSATSATTATNIAGGATGSIPYQTGAGATSMLAAGSGVLVGGSTPSYSTAPSLTGTNFTGIPNAALSNSSVTIGTTGIALGAVSLTLGGLTSVAVTQNPSTALQLATKQYVDGLVSSGITYHAPVKYEVPSTTGNLNATYSNGTGGVGATLTNAGTLAAFAPDGPTASPGDRILVYNQTNQFENGVYEVTTVGDGSTAWVLTRTTDTDSYGLKDANALGEGDAFFVTSGNTGAGETYVCNTSGTITFGTTAITFVQVSSAQVYSAGTGLTLTGTQFSLTTPVVLANGGTGLTSYTAGDLPYFASGTAFSKLAIGATNRILTSSGSAPQWSDPAGITVGSATTATSATSATTATTATNVAGGAANQIVYNTGAGATSFITAPVTAGHFLKWNGSAFAWDVAGSGTVTSITAGSYLTGGTITTSGTIAVDATDANTANKVVARDASGNFSAGTITAALSGNATSATNLAGGAASQIPYQTGSGATTFLANGTAGQMLLSNGAAAPSWSNVSGGTF